MPTRCRWPPPTRDGRPSVRMVLLKGADAAGLRLLHQPREPQGRRADRQPARRAVVPLEEPAPADPHRGRRSSTSPTPRPTPISPPAPGSRGSARWPPTSRARCPPAPSSSAGSPNWTRAIPATPCRGRRIGRAFAWCPRRSSSGRTCRSACTTGGCIHGTATAGGGRHLSLKPSAMRRWRGPLRPVL